MHTRSWVAVIAAWSFWVFPKGQAIGERLNFSLYTNTEGLPQRQVLAVTRDEQGYLWVGTYGGLSRFNGRSFLTLRTHHGLSSNGIQDIVAVDSGRLWVGTSGGGVCLVEALRATRCFHAPNTLTSEDVLDLEMDGKESVWVGGFDGVTRLFADGSSQKFGDADGKVLRNVWSIKKVGQRIIVGFSGGLAEIRGDRAHLLPVQVPDGGVRALLPTQRWLYVGCERGLFRLPASLEALQPELLVPNITVQDLSGGENNVWAATRTGLLHWDGQTLRTLTTKNGLPTEVVHRVLLDHEGILWMGTEEGLGKLVPGPFLTFTTADGLPHSFVRAIAEDAKGRLVVGTRNGLAVGDKDGSLQRFHSVFTERRVYAILQHPSGDLWVATNGGVVQLRNDQTARIWQEKDGLPDRFTFALAYDATTDELWLGTWSGTACLKRGKLVPLPPPLASARPLSMHVDQRGRLWIGLRDGKVLVRERNGNTKVLGAAEGFSDQVVWSIASDEQGVWLGTNGDGAFYVSDRGISRWDTSKGLVDDFVWQVLPDKKGRVWFFTSQGLDRLEAGNIRHFGAHDGLPDLEGSANACWQDSRGNLWFGTGSGLVRYDPQAENKALAPPQVLLESATFGNGVAVQPGKQLPSTHGRVVFSVVSLALRNEKALRYSYRLLPAQPSWSPPQAQGEIAFAALGPGSYRFEAVALDADGQRSETPVAFEFSVARPWWQSPLFLTGLVLLAVGLTVAYSRWRLARVQARARELERLVKERTRELAEKALELARLAETDELTGLPNRRKFFETLRSELQRLWRAPQETRLALLLVDLDNFKDINDTLGHTAGDLVLKAVGAALAASVRTTDTVARIGGDEFAVILPMTDRLGAAVVARKVLDAVSSVRVDFAGRTLSVTATAGLAVVAPTAAFAEEEITRLVQRADVALYAAKRRGGNIFLEDTETLA